MQRERERERERERDGRTDGRTDRQTDRRTNGRTDRQTDRNAKRKGTSYTRDREKAHIVRSFANFVGAVSLCRKVRHVSFDVLS